MTKYQRQTRLLAAVDCIIFGFDGETLKLLLIQRDFEPERGKWSLMGGFIQSNESPEGAATGSPRALEAPIAPRFPCACSSPRGGAGTSPRCQAAP